MRFGGWIILLIIFSLALIMSATTVFPGFIFGTDYAVLIWVVLFVLLAFGFAKIIFR